MSQTHPQSQGLPGLAERPHAQIIVYDGRCRFCVAQMRILAKLDLSGSLAFLSLHDCLADLVLPDVSFEQRMKAIILIDQNCHRHTGADAFRHLSKLLPLLWPVAPLLHIPGSRPVWQWLYNRVAKVRYRFGRVQCDGGTCHLH
jgi:predicted DCC family thiol-disulfide oxidoreductase YuxK